MYGLGFPVIILK